MKKFLAWWTQPCKWQIRYSGPFLLLCLLSLAAAPEENAKQVQLLFLNLVVVIVLACSKVLFENVNIHSCSEKHEFKNAGWSQEERIQRTILFSLFRIQVSQWEDYSRGVNWTNRNKLISTDVNGCVNGHQNWLQKTWKEPLVPHVWT